MRRAARINRRVLIGLLAIPASLGLIGPPVRALMSGPSPTTADVAYGPSPAQTLDLYRPAGPGPFPAVIYIHGGGWWNGDKGFIERKDVAYLLGKGVLVASINYRNLTEATRAGIFPPVLAPLHDARRALQFIRFNAARYAIDPKRIALYGGSAGGFGALWVGLSPSPAGAVPAPKTLDEVSTEVTAIGGINTPTTIDPQQMRDWVGPDLNNGGHAFGLPETRFDLFLNRRAEFAQYYPVLSPASLIRRTSPPVFLYYSNKKDEQRKDPMYLVHSPSYGFGFEMIARQRGAQVVVVDDGDADFHKKIQLMDFLVSNVLR